MGYFASAAAKSGGLMNQDTEQYVQKVPVRELIPGSPLTGGVPHNGQAIPFTLDSVCEASETYHFWPEQILIAILLLVSFVAPVFHLLG